MYAQRLGYRDQNLELFLLFFFFGIINFVFEPQVPFWFDIHSVTSEFGPYGLMPQDEAGG